MLSASFACLLMVSLLADACTGVRVKPKDGSEITGRTLEFGADLQSEGMIVPRGKTYQGTAPGNKPGLKWTTKYGAVGFNGLKLPVFIDGINEKGFGIGLFYFPGYAKYQDVPVDSTAKALAPWEIGTYLLTTAANVEEAVKSAKEVFVGSVALGPWKSGPPAHFRLHDATGKSVVLEYVDGKLHVHDNPLALMSNSPTFDWHMTNLKNYVRLSEYNADPIEVNNVKLTPPGQGSGMLGLPGDFTPPSRLVRAFAFTRFAEQVATAEDGVKQTFHLLNQFDIPKGAAREKDKDGPGAADYTLWTSVSDLTNRRFYFRTYENSRIRSIDLAKCDLTAKEIRYIPTDEKEEIVDVTGKAK